MAPTLPQLSSLSAYLNELLPTASFCSGSTGSSLNVELVLALLLLMVIMSLPGDFSFDN